MSNNYTAVGYQYSAASQPTVVDDSAIWPGPPVDAIDAVTRLLHPERIECRLGMVDRPIGVDPWVKLALVGRTVDELEVFLLNLYGRDPKLRVSSYYPGAMTDCRDYQYRNIQYAP